MQFNRLMLNLILYVFIFIIIVFMVGNIISSYYYRIINLSMNTTSASEITKFDLYMLKTVKAEDCKIKKIGMVDNDESSYYITFQKDDGTTYSFIKKGNILYYNRIKLCENVEYFRVVLDRSEKESITVDITILGEKHNLQYGIS